MPPMTGTSGTDPAILRADDRQVAGRTEISALFVSYLAWLSTAPYGTIATDDQPLLLAMPDRPLVAAPFIEMSAAAQVPRGSPLYSSRTSPRHLYKKPASPVHLQWAQEQFRWHGYQPLCSYLTGIHLRQGQPLGGFWNLLETKEGKQAEEDQRHVLQELFMCTFNCTDKKVRKSSQKVRIDSCAVIFQLVLQLG
ncbi:hypothetical protein HPB50_006477 [Hyalomma asiaticum]|uniref:Uncharacterized protein n=1 Tax=Hyalomma asiaticum TaxID=266040 RepID=A0ACB7T390_HYAAI|nr:hypothetical protein HPB50_006477 [Hyalomma asiaticum]